MKYVNGDWANAINGVWSPLYSWLMTPILLLFYNPFNASYVTRIVSLIVGFFTIIGINKLAVTFKLQRLMKRYLLITSIPMILFFAIFYDTPDLLVACLLIYYFSFIFESSYPTTSTSGALCGLIGALAFLSKSYILPFFIVHFIFFNILYYFKGCKINKMQVKKNLIIGLAVFFIISGIWIGALSEKYDKPTISTAINYNHAIIGPDYLKHQGDSLGLIKPPNPTATSVWEDPSIIKLKDWSPFESWENFEFQIKNIINNLYLTLFLIEYYSILSIAIIIISLYYILKQDTEKYFKTKLIYLLITISLYSAGYILMFIQERFFWPVIILLMIWGFYLISSLYKNKVLSAKLRNILIIILMGSFILTPVYGLITYPQTDGEQLSKTLKNNYGIHGNIASNDGWSETNKISYYLNSQYYGLPKNINNSSQLENELMANNITYYFVWGDSSNLTLISYKEITNGKIHGLKIYSWGGKNI
ncbi:hypothetical protein [Methanobacterium formicicum]|uniref:Glycosyltransferase RgtA/B/C/D-like domain-containing protein n=1 Tax=Methanobacterium formicicum (strain DSM 3637 / PP1) TaxID=1204725 RepID=K2RCI9_METFP|nr:hypothetical protein [Methanobacterium formicicum]EKF86024.1 hypothetical protein A994_06041 [Methanobacterium formicicum DSM 3637]